MRRSTLLAAALCLAVLLDAAPAAPGHGIPNEQAKARIFGRVTGFDGNPIAGANIELMDAGFEAVATAVSGPDGRYSVTADPGLYIALAAVKDYREKSLEYWAWNVPAFGDLEINPRFDRLEVYAVNAWRPQGGYASYEIYFRPMSLGKARAVIQKAGGTEGLAKLPEIDIAPELGAADIRVTIDGEQVPVLVVNRVKEASGPAQQMFGYLIQTPLPKAQSSGPWVVIDLVVSDPRSGEKGAGRFYFHRPEWR
jgi:hypothetical protein